MVEFIRQFFKPLFPSWKFFDESTDTPVLLYKYLDEPESEWKLVFPPPSKSFVNVLWNPKGNLYLAYHSHMQQLMGDLTAFDENKLDQFHQHISYKITANFVKNVRPSRSYHFKVSAIQKTGETFSVIEDILLSEEIHL